MGAVRAGGPDPLIGTTIVGRYRIDSLIARGGMGKVYKAEQSALGRICALKLLVPDERQEQHADFFRRFSREAATAAKLSHPNSVTVFDYGKDDERGLYFIAMEYIAGRTLHRVLHDEGALPEMRANRIAQQICRSLAEAHGHGLVHRDLKPSNVLLVDRGDETDFVKVLDFGLVKDVTGQQDDLTQQGVFMGSPKYTAPEQVLGTELSPRADIYSLGIVLYEMLSGKPPFDKKVHTATLMAHVNEPPPPLAERAPLAMVSPAMEAIVMRCLEKSPEQRFQSMRECLVALKTAAGEPIDSGVPSRSSMPARMSAPSQPSLSFPPAAPSGSGSFPTTLAAAPPQGGDSPAPPQGSAVVDSLSPPQAPPTFTGPVSPPRQRSLQTLALTLVAAAVGGVAVLVASGRGKSASDASAPAIVHSVFVPIAVPASSFADTEPGPSRDFRIVRIESDPPGARVSDRGTEVCLATPCRLVLQGAGITAEYQLELTKAGYKPTSLTVRPSDETAKAELEQVAAVAAIMAPSKPAVSAGPAAEVKPAEEEPAPPATREPAATAAPPPTPAPPKAEAAIAAPAATADVMHFQEGMTRPVPLSAPAVVYTREARQAKVEGTVLARCVITTAGTLTNCRIVKGLPHMNEAVLAALAASRYKPVMHQGRAVNVDYVFSIKLVLP